MLDDRSYMRAPDRPAWSMTKILLVSLVVCFLLQSLLEGLKGPRWVMEWLALSSYGIAHGRFYQLLTFQFLHGGFLHLLMNMIGLYFFGRAMEDMLGSRGMLKLYLLSGVAGGLFQVGLAFAVPAKFWPPVVGASAGIFGLIAAFATRVPDQPITWLIFFILPVTFKARVLLIIAACFALAGVLGPLLASPTLGGGIAHGAHLGGMLAGIVWIRWGLWQRPALNFWRPFWRRHQPRRAPSRTASRRPWRSTAAKNEDLPPAEFISREVDPILEKISAYGIHSLTERERQILEAARSKMARR
jgi:membrane associated rhomboid family serine protease